MNEFTKEELETMRDGIFCAMSSSSLWRTDINNILVDKIQSMIDNYCDHEEVVTADMKECHAICVLNENNKTYFTLNSDTFPCGTYASLDMVMKIICMLGIGGNKFSNEWIDRIIFRLKELKSDN